MRFPSRPSTSAISGVAHSTEERCVLHRSGGEIASEDLADGRGFDPERCYDQQVHANGIRPLAPEPSGSVPVGNPAGGRGARRLNKEAHVMRRRAVICIAILALAALASPAEARSNCVNKTTRGDAQEWLCTVVSDFGTRFQDCFTFEKLDRDNFAFNVEGLTPVSVLGGCNDEGSLTNPRFGRSTDWMATFGFFDAAISITFAGGDEVEGKPAQFAGRASSEFGDRFYYRCKRNTRNVCPLLRSPSVARPASGSNWKKPGR